MERKAIYTGILIILILTLISCSGEKKEQMEKEIKIIFLHHSTGERIWYGDRSSLIAKSRRKFSDGSSMTNWFKKYNQKNHTNYSISELEFPKAEPYGWKNYPFDYYNIWVKNAGNIPYMKEPTLELLTEEYDVIIWKHCFPVGDMEEDTGNPDIDSEVKSMENYTLQYQALKNKMLSFPDNKFIVWTGAAHTRGNTTTEKARRTKEFFDWVRTEWDDPSDNIYLWDFFNLETEGDIYLKEEYATSPEDSHPNDSFADRVYQLLCSRITDVIESGGTNTALTGLKLEYIPQ